MNKLYFGEIKESKSGMPELEIIVEEGEKKRNYKLVPFRAYRFQVTREDGGDFGASEVVGLGNLINLQPNRPDDTKSFSAFASNTDNFGKSFMNSLAFEAVIKFARHYIGDNENGEYQIDIFSFKASDILSKFVNKSYDYVEKLTESYR